MPTTRSRASTEQANVTGDEVQPNEEPVVEKPEKEEVSESSEEVLESEDKQSNDDGDEAKEENPENGGNEASNDTDDADDKQENGDSEDVNENQPENQKKRKTVEEGEGDGVLLDKEETSPKKVKLSEVDAEDNKVEKKDGESETAAPEVEASA